MSHFQFVHASDLHLDTPFEGISRVAPTVAETLRDASLQTWDALVKLCIDRKAAFLLLAGDIYDGPERGLRAQLRFCRGLEQLSEHGIDTFVVHGNHDPLEDGWSAIREWPRRVRVFGHEQVETVALERGGELIATVHGISYGQRDVSENLARRFRRGREPGFHIALLHCNVGGDPHHLAYSPCTLDDLRDAGMHYWALGHVHQRKVLIERDPCVVYPGNLQGRSPNSSESGPKGAMLVEVRDGGIVGLKFEPLDCVRFFDVEVDISNLVDLHQMQVQVARELENARATNGERSLVARLTLRGRGRIHSDLRRPGVLQELMDQLRWNSETEKPFVWVSVVRDRTQHEIDRDAIRRRGDFSSELLRLVQELTSEPERLPVFEHKHNPDIRRPLLQPWIRDVDPAGESSVLAQAEALALDRLERTPRE